MIYLLFLFTWLHRWQGVEVPFGSWTQEKITDVIVLIHWFIFVITYSVLRWYRTYYLIVMLKHRCWVPFIIFKSLMDRNLAQMLLCIFIVLTHFFNFSSGIVSKILSQMCGRLYFPVFLLMVGLFTLNYLLKFCKYKYKYKLYTTCLYSISVNYLPINYQS